MCCVILLLCYFIFTVRTRILSNNVLKLIDMYVLVARNGDNVIRDLTSKYHKSMKMCNSGIYQPCETLLSHSKCDYGIVVLNAPIHVTSQRTLVMNLWSEAKVRVTVDGGTDRWLQWLKTNDCLSTLPLPDLITGDFDSVSKEGLKYFSDRQVTIIKTPDQNFTDFTKALWQLKYYCADKNVKLDCLYVLADTSGRLDQILGNIQTLFLAKDILPSCYIFQIASSSMSWLLSNGKHTISIPETLRKRKEWCALIPIGHSCQVSTTGLKWNLCNSELKFGKLVSTSNTYDGSSLVTIETDNPLLWSMGIEFLL